MTFGKYQVRSRKYLVVHVHIYSQHAMRLRRHCRQEKDELSTWFMIPPLRRAGVYLIQRMMGHIT